jgi:serralysin
MWDRQPVAASQLLATDTPASSFLTTTTASLAASNAALAAAAAPLTPAAIESEVAYLSGVNAANRIAATSYGTWNGNSPATYDPTLSGANKWGASTVGTGGGTVTYYFDPASLWTATEKAALAGGLMLWSAEANIQFAETAALATASFTFTRGQDGGASTGIPGTYATVGGTTLGANASGGNISIDTSVPGFGPIGGAFTAIGGYAYQTFLHEEGHMLGLGHGGGYNGSVNSATEQFSVYDSRLYTLMSYIDPSDTTAKYYASAPVTGTDWGRSADGYLNVPTTPMMLDIAAAQRIYGVATSGPLGAGGQTFGFNSNIAGAIHSYFDFTINTAPVVTLWDGGTNNTLDVSGWSSNATINLAPGTFSSAGGMTNNIGIALGTQINTAIGGSGNDTITGNSFANTLSGGRGNDILDGGAGNDTVDYSADTAARGATAVSVYLSSNIAVDGYGNYDTITNIENVVGSDINNTGYNDVILGDGVANSIDARGGGDIVVANAGDDVVYGGLGVDAIYGGDGNDTLIGSNFTAIYNGEIDYLFGDAGNDTIYVGTAGHAYIDGGLGNDKIVGGSGTDYVLSGRGNDVVTLGGGVDLAIIYATELVAGEYDVFTDFTDGQDYIYASASLAHSVVFGNNPGYAYMATTVAGGTHYTLFQGVTAAQIQDQIFFNL